MRQSSNFEYGQIFDPCRIIYNKGNNPPTPADSRGSASEKRFQAVGAVARRPGPYFRALLFETMLAVAAGRQLRQLVFL